MLRQHINWVLAWLVLAVGFVAFVGRLNWTTYYRLAQEGVPVEGLVLSEPDRRNHSVSHYSYTVASKTYSDVGRTWASKGAKITVYYHPIDPTVNCVGDPRDHLRDESQSIGLVALTFPTFILGMFHARFTPWKAPLNRRKRWPALLHSDLSLQECRDRLAQAVDQECFSWVSILGYPGKKDFIGAFDGTCFRLQKRKHYGDAFMHYFFGELVEEGSGTRIKGLFDMPLFPKLFSRIWFAGVLLIGGPIFVACLWELATGIPTVEGDSWVGLIVFPVMLSFGLFVTGFGRRKERRRTMAFLREVLQAHDVRPDTGAPLR